MSNVFPPDPNEPDSEPRRSSPFRSSFGGDPFGDRGVPVPGEQPGPARTLAWLTLLTGIWSIIFATSSFFTWGACCFFVIPIFQIIVGVAGVAHGTRMVSNPRIPPEGGLIVAYLLCIINMDVVSLISGIIQSVLRNDDRVRAWYRIP